MGFSYRVLNYRLFFHANFSATKKSKKYINTAPITPSASSVFLYITEGGIVIYRESDPNITARDPRNVIPATLNTIKIYGPICAKKKIKTQEN